MPNKVILRLQSALDLLIIHLWLILIIFFVMIKQLRLSLNIFKIQHLNYGL